MNKKIDDALGIDPVDDLEEVSNKDGVSVYKQKENLPSTDVVDDEKERDMKYARENIMELIENGTRALQELEEVANQTQMSGAYETYAKLMKTLVEANKDFVVLSEKKNQKETDKVKGNTINNNLNISTSDLLKMIKGDTENGS